MAGIPDKPLRIAASLARNVAKRVNRSVLETPPPSVDAKDEDGLASATMPRVGKYDADLIALVRRRPGITVAEAASELGIHATVLYPVIRRLEMRSGTIVKRQRELHPVEALGHAVETLWCEAGHEWVRSTVRGRKPRRCPEHR